MAKKKKETSVVKWMSYKHHQRYFDKKYQVYMVALKKDGTDSYFVNFNDVLDAIDFFEKK